MVHCHFQLHRHSGTLTLVLHNTTAYPNTHRLSPSERSPSSLRRATRAPTLPDLALTKRAGSGTIYWCSEGLTDFGLFPHIGCSASGCAHPRSYYQALGVNLSEYCHSILCIVPSFTLSVARWVEARAEVEGANESGRHIKVGVRHKFPKVVDIQGRGTRSGARRAKSITPAQTQPNKQPSSSSVVLSPLPFITIVFIIASIHPHRGKGS